MTVKGSMPLQALLGLVNSYSLSFRTWRCMGDEIEGSCKVATHVDKFPWHQMMTKLHQTLTVPLTHLVDTVSINTSWIRGKWGCREGAEYNIPSTRQKFLKSLQTSPRVLDNILKPSITHWNTSKRVRRLGRVLQSWSKSYFASFSLNFKHIANTKTAMESRGLDASFDPTMSPVAILVVAYDAKNRRDGEFF